MSDNPNPDYPGPFQPRWLAPRYWSLWLGFGLLWLLTFLPGGIRRWLGARFGNLMYARNAKRRAIVDTNLEWCFPEFDKTKRDAMAQEYFRVLAQTLLDYGVLWWAPRRRLERQLKVEGLEHLQSALDEGRRAILFTGHCVSLDFGAEAMSLYVPVVGPMKQARNELMDWFLAKGRVRFDCEVVTREAGMRGVISAVRKRGRVMYYLPDEDMGASQKVAYAPFFGIKTATLTTLSRLARMCDADVFPLMTYYNPDDGSYRIVIDPPLQDYPVKEGEEDAARVNAELERMIRRVPEQYMWSMRIFQSRPDGSPPPYKMKGKPGSGPRPRPEE